MPVDECARGHGRARVNKPAERLGTGVLPCSAEDLSAFPAPSSRLTAAEAPLHLGTGYAALLLQMQETRSCSPRRHAHLCLGGLCALPACARLKRLGESKTEPPALLSQTWSHGEGELLKSSERPRGSGGAGLGRRGAALGPSLFSAARLSVLFRPSVRPRPSRSAGTFPLAWPRVNKPCCAAWRRHVTWAGGGRALRS